MLNTYYDVKIKGLYMDMWLTAYDKTNAIKKCLEAKREGREFSIKEWTSKDLTEEVNAL